MAENEHDSPRRKRRYERTPEHDRRIGRGDDFAGDAWHDRDTNTITWTAVGSDPNAQRELQHIQHEVGTAEWNKAVTDAALEIDARELSNPGADEPVLQMGMRIPAQDQFRSYMAAERIAQSNNVGDEHDRTRDAQPGATYKGTVLDVTATHILQKVGGAVISHERKSVSGRSFNTHEDMKGGSVDISYRHGRAGIARPSQPEKQKDVNEKQKQRDHGARDRSR